MSSDPFQPYGRESLQLIARHMGLNAGVHIALPEVLAEAQPHREIEYHVDVGARFATRRHQRGSQLNPFAGSLIDAEADAQVSHLDRNVADPAYLPV